VLGVLSACPAQQRGVVIGIQQVCFCSFTRKRCWLAIGPGFYWAGAYVTGARPDQTRPMGLRRRQRKDQGTVVWRARACILLCCSIAHPDFLFVIQHCSIPLLYFTLLYFFWLCNIHCRLWLLSIILLLFRVYFNIWVLQHTSLSNVKLLCLAVLCYG